MMPGEQEVVVPLMRLCSHVVDTVRLALGALVSAGSSFVGCNKPGRPLPDERDCWRHLQSDDIDPGKSSRAIFAGL